jgi:hypothetical protein
VRRSVPRPCRHRCRDTMIGRRLWWDRSPRHAIGGARVRRCRSCRRARQTALECWRSLSTPRPHRGCQQYGLDRSAVLIVGGNIAGYTRIMTTAIVLKTSEGEFIHPASLYVVARIVPAQLRADETHQVAGLQSVAHKREEVIKLSRRHLAAGIAPRWLASSRRAAA